MSRNNTHNTSLGALGVALAGLVLSGSAFAVQPLAQGYMVAAAHAAAEGKCGEGKCGKPLKTTANKKTAEGKCGEGQCGDERFNTIDTNDDGKISRAELLTVVPDGSALFASRDKDRDGYISERESYEGVKAAYNVHGRELPSGLFANPPEN